MPNVTDRAPAGTLQRRRCSRASVSVAFGDDRSQTYKLPDGLQVRSFCLNPCCTE